jgi:hypothetical protein
VPDIQISYRPGALSVEEIEELKARLRLECVRRFSVGQLKLSLTDFRFHVFEATPPSELDRDVIVRIELHNFAERIQADRPDSNARELASELRDKLMYRHSTTGWRIPGPRSVGVSLVFPAIYWASA